MGFAKAVVGCNKRRGIAVACVQQQCVAIGCEAARVGEFGWRWRGVGRV